MAFEWPFYVKFSPLRTRYIRSQYHKITDRRTDGRLTIAIPC